MTDEAVTAIRNGQAVILPTDTVYGLCATPYTAEACLRLYALKARPGTQPTALLASDVDMLLELVPELRGRAGTIARALLPGPFTLVLPNPAARYRWITGDTPEKIGVRVAELPDVTAAVLERVGAVAATSANLRGGPEPRRPGDVPAELREAAGAVVEAGDLPGVPSTVVDASRPEPIVLREGAVPAGDALARIRAAVA